MYTVFSFNFPLLPSLRKTQWLIETKALYNMHVQVASIISSNIYRADDAPLYKRGNSVLIGILCWNLVVYAASKAYYVWRNKRRERRWDELTSQQKLEYMDSQEDLGSKRLDFRFAS